jgi:hypothetical protein
VIRDKAELLKINYRVVRNSLKALPARQRKSFLSSLVGMIMTEAGIAYTTSFKPEEISEDFRQGPGRPRLEGYAEIV